MSAETRHSSAFARARGPGMIVGDFYIDSEVGKGSFAQVYMGVHKDRKEVVAIKSVDLAKLSQNKKLKENLNGEIKILKTLRHPHIVALHDCVESPTHIHLVMEYCELGDLSLFIKKREKLSTHPATHDMARKYPSAPNTGLHEVIIRHFLKQLVSALHFLRSKNCIHRDVKPQNLLLLPSPQYRHANSRPIMTASHDSLMPIVGLPSLPMLKLADFGFARVLPSTSLADTLCGSPLYMAPEILRYERYDAKADLWSVGTVLFEMVTGRPPTRARNHVELLRKIEAAQDMIVFPREVVVSSEMRALIRALLKRHPLERMGFDHFFSHPVVTGPIPGLVEDDVPIAMPLERTSSRRSLNELPQPHQPQYQQHDSASSPSRRSSRQPDERLSDLAVNVPRSPRERTLSSPRVSSPVERYGRPPIEGTARHTYAAGQDGSGEGLGIRPKPQSATTAPIRPPRLSDTGAKTAHARHRMTEEELAAQDVADMREYVVIEKKQVEINAFADEIDAKGRAPPTVVATGAAASATSAAAAAAASASVSAAGAAAAAGASSSPRSQALVSRTQGHDISVSPTSTTSAISRAIHDASLRLFGYYPHAAGRVPRGQSPPPFYSPYPVYSTPQLSSTAAGLIMGDGKHGAGSDDDSRAVKVFEELASRSDVVYGFAEVKFRQLFPTAPSAERSLGTPEDGVSGGGGDANPAEDEDDDDDDDDLTAEAIVCLSEEAFVLYYKALTLLAKTMDLANGWWSRKTAFPGHPMTQRVNSVVQWVRTRFNEVLEKTEMVKLKLVEGQKRLPDTHPHHPSNNGAGGDSIASTPTLLGAAVMTTGITAEKLMYDRAVDMSRVAAIREISHSDLRGCEISYITAIRMLEVVLDSDDESLRKKAPGALRESREEGSVGGGGGEDMATTHLDSEDRRAVRKLIQMISARLSTVEKKMQDIAEAEKSQQALQLRRRSGDVTPRSFPSHPSPS